MTSKSLFLFKALFLLVSINTFAFSSILPCSSLFQIGKQDTINRFESSGQKGLFIDGEGQKWIVKDNPTNLIVNEYVASKIYAHISEDTTSDIRLLACPTPALAIKVTPKFYAYSTERLQIEGFTLAHAADSARLFHKKPVSGLVEALYATLVTFDEDVDNGINFALVESENSVRVTRFDFDDSFKFYDSFYITEIYVGPEIAQKARQHGIGVGQIRTMLYARYHEPSLDWLHHKFPSLRNAGLKNRLKPVHSKIYADKEEIFDLVEEAYEEVSEVFTNSQLISVFDLNILRKKARENGIEVTPDNSSWSDWLKGGDPAVTTQQLADFTNGMLLKRMNTVQKWIADKVEL